MIASQAFDQPPQPQYPAYVSARDAHIAWCRGTYRSYDAQSDTWLDFENVAHQCIETP